jgi:uncharacterized protein (TIGR02996 family)
VNDEDFISAIFSKPDDPLPKLVYADYLDERGEGSLAFAYRWCASKGKQPRYCRYSGFSEEITLTTSTQIWWEWHFYSLALGTHNLPDALSYAIDPAGYRHSRHHSYQEAMNALARGLKSVKEMLECD